MRSVGAVRFDARVGTEDAVEGAAESTGGAGDEGTADHSASDHSASIEPELHKLLDGEPPEVAALVRRLRGVVGAAHPELRQRVAHGWHGLAFHHPRGGYVLALFPRKGGVNVGFELGADLHDPHGRLLGEGRRTRDVRIEIGADTEEEELLLDYVDLAVDTAIDRAADKNVSVRARRLS
jgi:hypothetical protein